MTRRGSALCGLLVWALAASPVAAQTVHGFFEGVPPVGAGLPQNSLTGAPGFTGWVVADGGVRRVIVMVDGFDVLQARYGGIRPDVTAQFPGFPDSAAPGFTFVLNTTDFNNGLHHVSVDVELMNGSRRSISPVRTYQFTNNTSILRPFGRINRPNRNATLAGNCDVSEANRRLSVIEGWAVDLGVEIGDTGIGFVELLLDGVILANTRRDCRFSIAGGGFSDCYGLPRLDIENRFPFAIDAPNAGFRFVMDVGALITLGDRSEGQHIVTIRAGDVSNQFENIDEFPVFFACSENLGNEPSFGLIETPGPGRTFTGLMRFEGWTLDAQGVARVDIYVDGLFVTSTTLDPNLIRSGVTATYPGFPDSTRPVFRTFVDSNLFVDGLHQVQVSVIDDLGAETIIGETTFTVDNDFPLSSFLK